MLVGTEKVANVGMFFPKSIRQKLPFFPQHLRCSDHDDYQTFLILLLTLSSDLLERQLVSENISRFRRYIDRFTLRGKATFATVLEFITNPATIQYEHSPLQILYPEGAIWQRGRHFLLKRPSSTKVRPLRRSDAATDQTRSEPIRMGNHRFPFDMRELSPR